MSHQSKHLFLTIAYPPHVAGVTASISTSITSFTHPKIQAPPTFNPTHPLKGMFVPTFAVKPQRKRPRHDPDSESDGDDSEAEENSTSKKRTKIVRSSAQMILEAFEIEKSESESESESESITAKPSENEVGNTQDLILKPNEILNGTIYASAQVNWALITATGILQGIQKWNIILQNQIDVAFSKDPEKDMDIPNVGPFAEHPLVQMIAAVGEGMFGDGDGSPLATREEFKKLARVMRKVQASVAVAQCLHAVLGQGLGEMLAPVGGAMQASLRELIDEGIFDLEDEEFRRELKEGKWAFEC